MTDRVLGLVFLGLSAWYTWTAGAYEASFGDPLGPAAFPRVVGIPAMIISLGLIFRPEPGPGWPRGGVALSKLATIALFVAYAYLLIPLGFILSTFLAVTLFAMMFGAPPAKAALCGAITAPGLFLVFDTLLGLSLPLAPSL